MTTAIQDRPTAVADMEHVPGGIGTVVGRGQVTTIRADSVTGWDIVTVGTGRGVMIIPRKVEHGTVRFALIEEFRHPQSKTVLEFPRGGVDRGESVERAAARELAEETAMLLPEDDMCPLGILHPDSGILDTEISVFLAPIVNPLPFVHDDNRDVHWMTYNEILAAIGDGRITCGMTIAGLTMMQAR